MSIRDIARELDMTCNAVIYAGMEAGFPSRPVSHEPTEANQ
jgi:hypothetical protein